MIIESASNSRLKLIKKLLNSASARREQGLFVCEGIRFFSELPPERIHSVYVTEEFAKANKTVLFEKTRDPVFVKESVFRQISDTKTPQGILALVRRIGYNLNDLLKNGSVQEPFFWLIVERLQDPGNLGTIIRTAEGTGVTGVICSSDSVDPFHPKVVRSTMGSILRVPVLVSEDLLRDVALLKAYGIRIYGAHLTGHALYEKDFRGPLGFVIGNEGRGMTEKLSIACDELLRIPMKGKVESLNAAVSTAVISYEVLRQRG